MKSLIATLILASSTFAALQPAYAATPPSSTDSMTPVVCVTDGCTDGPYGGKTRR